MNKEHLIEQYFSKSLSQEARKEFNHLIITDPEFATEAEFQNNLKIAIKKEEQNALKKELQNFEAEENTTSFNFKKWFIAASIISLLAIPSFWYFNNTIDTQELYVENFEPYRNVVQPIVRGETSDDIKTKAFTAYETKNYSEAIQYFDELLQQNHDKTIAFYKANALLKLNKTEAAVAIFKTNLKSTDSLDAKNNWYLALGYLKLDDSEKAIEQLKIVCSNPLSDYKKEAAKNLLKQLE